MAVCRRIHYGFGADVAIRAWPVLDDEWLTQPLCQPLPHETRRDVRPAPRRKANDDAHWPRRIGLRPRDVWSERQRDSASGQVQEFATRKFHFASYQFVRLSGITEYLAADYSGLMLANLTTLPHFSISTSTSLPKSAGEPGSGVPASSTSRAFNLGSTRPALISLFSLSMISCGVF